MTQNLSVSPQFGGDTEGNFSYIRKYAYLFGRCQFDVCYEENSKETVTDLTAI